MKRVIIYSGPGDFERVDKQIEFLTSADEVQEFLQMVRIWLDERHPEPKLPQPTPECDPNPPTLEIRVHDDCTTSTAVL